MNKNLNILIIDSDPLFLDSLEGKLKSLGFKLCCSAPPGSPINQLDELNPGLAILGPSLNADTCLNCTYKLKIIDCSMPILISCDDLCLPEGSVNTPFDGMYGIGAGYEPEEISTTIKRALEYRSDRQLRPEFPILIGQSQGIIEIREKIRTLSDKDITVLITGETGTGKELIARAIHFYSPRSHGPLVRISAGALPPELLESEVFGFQKGAFTGAHKTKPGRIELANGGTLFIDEIGALSLSLQAKFLQVLEEKAFSRLGGTSEKVLDVRVVAATNADLGSMVKAGSFRKDLFYRLNIMHISIPPLRERKDDIALLTHYLLNKYCFELKKSALELPDYVIDFLLSYHWPGNVRELENVIRRAIVLRDWNFLFNELSLGEPSGGAEQYAPSSGDAPLLDWSDDHIKKFFEASDFSLKKIAKAYVSDAERTMIMKALRETEWNRKKAAKRLGVSYKTLLNRIEEFDLKP